MGAKFEVDQQLWRTLTWIPLLHVILVIFGKSLSPILELDYRNF